MSYAQPVLADALQLGTATLYEALGLPSAALDPALRPIWAGAAVAGAAYPLVCAPGDNLALHQGLQAVPPGSVLVVDCSGFVAGYWGEVLTVAAEAAGVRGLVIDGGVRDVAALRARGFPVFARGVSLRGTHKSCAPSVGAAITCAGAPVAPGDLVVADEDGVLVVPASVVSQTLRAAKARAAKEIRMMEQIQAGASTLDLLGLSG